jgi:hypothetical protein
MDSVRNLYWENNRVNKTENSIQSLINKSREMRETIRGEDMNRT